MALKFVQELGSTAFNTTTSAVLPIGANTTAGNRVILAIGRMSDASTSVAVSDSRGNAWTVDKDLGVGGIGRTLIASAYLTTALTTSDHITVAFGTGVSARYAIEEYSGILAVSPVDVTGATSGTSGTASTLSVTTVTDNALVFSAIGMTGIDAPTVPAGFTKRGAGGDGYLTVADSLKTSHGAVGAGWSWSTSDSYIEATVAYKPLVVIATLARAASDSLTVTDAAARGAVGRGRVSGDTVAVATDVAARGAMAKGRAAVDALAVADVTSRSGAHPRTVGGDVITVSDAAVAGAGRLSTDLVTVAADTAARAATARGRVSTDSVVVAADVATRAAAARIGVAADSVTVGTDLAVRASVARGRASTDSVTVSGDTAVRLSHAAKTATDSLTVTDAAAKGASGRTSADTVTISDAAGRPIAVKALGSAVLATGGLATFTLGAGPTSFVAPMMSRTAADAFTVSDAATHSAIGHTAIRTASDSIGGASYQALVLAASPLGNWRLGDLSGTTAVDAMGLNAGMYSGGFTLGQPGIPGGAGSKAVALDGSTGYVDLGNPVAFQVTTGSLVAWFKSTDSTGSFKAIVIKPYAFSLYYSGLTGNLGYYDWSASVWHDSGVAVNDGLLHRATLTFTGGTATLYLDGTALITSAPLGINPVTSPMSIGANGGVGQNLAATFAEVALYGTVLSPAQESQLYSAGIAASGGIVDTATAVLGTHSILRTAADTVASIHDAATRGATAKLRVVGDAVTVSDVAVRQAIGQAKTSTDNFTVSDLAARGALALGRLSADSLSVSEVAFRQATGRARTAGDSATFSDSASSASGLTGRAASDLLSIVDVAVRQVLARTRAAADAFTASDLAGKTRNVPRSAGDLLVIAADLASRAIMVAARSVNDLVAIVDMANKVGALLPTGADTFIVVDVATRSALARVRASVDAWTVLDVAARLAPAARSAADAFSASESASRTQVGGRSSGDVFGLSDVAQRAAFSSRGAVDSASVTDTTSRLPTGRIRFSSDLVNVGDQIIGNGSYQTRVAADSFTSADTASRLVITFARFSADTVSLSDAGGPSTVRTRQASDNWTVSDTSSRAVVSYYRVAADLTMVSDRGVVGRQLRNAADGFVLADLAIRWTVRSRSVADSFTVADSADVILVRFAIPLDLQVWDQIATVQIVQSATMITVADMAACDVSTIQEV